MRWALRSRRTGQRLPRCGAVGCSWRWLGAIALLACGGEAGRPARPSEPRASLIVSGGPILTLDDQGRQVRGLAVADGKVLALGESEELERYRGSETVGVDLGGRVLLPAFVDHHVHLLNMGTSLLWGKVPPANFVDLAAATSQHDLAERLRVRAAGLPPGAWILGKGWSQGAWGSGELPDHRPLTASAPAHPVFLSRADGHAGWINVRAMGEAGIDRLTPDPPGGSIRRHRDGSPTGVLLERANELVTPLLPPPSDEDVMAAFRAAAEALASQGVTEAHDAGFLAVPGIVDLRLDLERYLGLLRLADEERPLAVRVHLMIPAPSALADRVVAEPETLRELSPRLRITHLKLFMDGALGSRGALLSHPYADDPSTRGVRRMTPEELRREAGRALDSGLDVATHAIGDQAIGEVLDVYGELLRSRPDVDPRRLRIEHFSYAAETDFERAADLGIIASIQPNFVLPDDQGTSMEDSRVGRDASSRVYAWGRLLERGARLAFGSDYFTRPWPPLNTFYAAVTRKNAAGQPAEGWHPGEILDRESALRLAAGGLGSDRLEPRRGQLVVGGPADFVILSADPLSAAEDRLLDVEVDATFLAGESTFQRRGD